MKWFGGKSKLAGGFTKCDVILGPRRCCNDVDVFAGLVTTSSNAMKWGQFLYILNPGKCPDNAEISSRIKINFTEISLWTKYLNFCWL